MRSRLPARNDAPGTDEPAASGGFVRAASRAVRAARGTLRVTLLLAVVVGTGTFATARLTPTLESSLPSAVADDAAGDRLSDALTPVPGQPSALSAIEAASRSLNRGAPPRAVGLTVDGSRAPLLTRAQTVAEMLSEAGVELSLEDEVSVPLDATPVGEIVITRVAYKDLGATRELGYSTLEHADASLDKGRREVVTAGKTGTESFVYRVRLVNGVEESRELQLHTFIPAVDEVVRVGTRVPPPPAPAPQPAAAPRSAAAAPARPSGAYTGANPREIGRSMAAARGWGGSQFSCLERLWTKESNWNPYAMNRSSGAYGIPQSLPGNKMASAGGDWRTNPRTQIAWGLSYIAARYGTPCSAWAHSQAVNWY